MHWHEFVFSNERKTRCLRHFVFWLMWWVYYSIVFFLYQLPQQPNSPGYYNYANFNSLIILKSLLLVLLQGVVTYYLIYFLLPRYTLKKNWFRLFAGFLLLALLIITATYLMYLKVFPFINYIFHVPLGKPERTQLWSIVSIGLLNAPKAMAAATAIKLLKNWWLKQKEKEKLEQEKINAELQLLKAQIRPGFLFNSLNNIYAYSLAGSPRASEMLLKLSDLLSYMLYESDKSMVPLEKEIEIMKEYMSLEKVRLSDSLEMEMNITGELEGKMIAPFLLLPFIESSFKQSSHVTGQAWINMDIEILGDNFTMKLTNGIEGDSKKSDEYYLNGFTNVQKRLTLLYPEKHELKLSTEQEMQLVLLKIQLYDFRSATVNENNITNENKLADLQLNLYVPLQ